MSPELKKALVRSLVPITSRVRTDVSAVKVEDGTSRWTSDALNATTLERHVNGGPARGACPIKAGEDVTMLGLLDLDSHRGETPWVDMLMRASVVADTLRLWGYSPIAFRSSGGRGIHIYLLWDTPQDAYSVRQALGAVIESCGYKDGAGTGGVASGYIEVFPKQNSVSTTGFGNQFILPLAGASEPLDLDLGLALGRDAAVGLAWPMSDPVPVLDAPSRALVAQADNADELSKVRAALFAIPNTGSDVNAGYGWWWPLMCAVHEATGGSSDAEELCVEWSEQNPRFNEVEFRERIWPYMRTDGRASAYTRATLYQRALQSGWKIAPATPDGFEDVAVVEESPHGTLEHVADTAVSTAGNDGRDLPGFERDKQGTILATIGNVLMALRRPDVCGWSISHDQFRDEIMISTNGGVAWRGFRDADYTRMREYLARNGFAEIGKEAMRDCVELVAQEKHFDSAILWLNSLEWDETPRIDTFMTRYLNCEDSPYTVAVGQYMWTALAGRVLSPGCQADMVPVLIGSQGLKKSSAVMAMSPAPEFYAEISFAEKEDDLARKMRGRLVAEIGELTGFRKKEVEAMKAFITRRHENWIPKFKEFGTTFPRRLLFIATTNQEKFLVDDTGNRRWLPVLVGTTDMPALTADVMQLWAEAAVRFKANGIAWEDAERLAREVHADHEEEDPWVERVATWLESSDAVSGSRVSERCHLTTSMVLAEAMRLDIGRSSKGDEMRAGRVLKKMGYVKRKVREGNRVVSQYVATSLPPEKEGVATDAPF